MSDCIDSGSVVDNVNAQIQLHHEQWMRPFMNVNTNISYSWNMDPASILLWMNITESLLLQYFGVQSCDSWYNRQRGEFHAGTLPSPLSGSCLHRLQLLADCPNSVCGSHGRVYSQALGFQNPPLSWHNIKCVVWYRVLNYLAGCNTGITILSLL